MRPEKILRFILVNGAAIGLGATVATSCVGVEYPLVAFRCDPQQDSNCPETHFCCSDDPAAVGGAVPQYVGKTTPDAAAPYFSGESNALSRTGMCVRTDDIAGQGLMEFAALNCPIPCNPTWESSQINAVCGDARVCCQTVALEAKDCVNDGGTFRPVSGADIVAGVTAWRPADHATHQDPNGSGCLALGGNDNQSSEFQDCIRQLSVADQRGFCMALGTGQTCPTEQPNFIDACSLMNGGAPPA